MIISDFRFKQGRDWLIFPAVVRINKHFISLCHTSKCYLNGLEIRLRRLRAGYLWTIAFVGAAVDRVGTIGILL